MAKFDPKTQYSIVPEDFKIKDFHDYVEEFVVRPPYQRKTVWTLKKQRGLLDSLLRKFYVPRIVIRLVRLGEDKTVNEVIDGQQRITVVQKFFANELTLPKSLKDIHPEMPGSTYSKLPAELRRYVDRISFQADIVHGIDDPKNHLHQEIATTIFWRLQQGETLNYMEVAHSRLSSLARNFVVKYGDDQRFDYDNYVPLNHNPDKHKFFKIIDRNNNRMQHLSLLTRILLIEKADGSTDIRDSNLMEYIDDQKRDDGIGNWSLEEMTYAKSALRNMNLFFKIFEEDTMVADGSKMKEFRIEYFIISMYLLLKHLAKYYVFAPTEKELFRDFVIYFHKRWRSSRRDTDKVDTDILIFSDNRQQTMSEIEVRDRILRQTFFQYVASKGHEMITKDERRAFSELERIQIYRNDNGLCQMCLEDGKPEKEAIVLWKDYQADHVIPHSLGGQTEEANAQVLCSFHNQLKGATIT